MTQKYLFYIIDNDEGTVQGTNIVEQVEQFIENDQYTIIHSQSGTYWCGSRKENKVEEIVDEGLEDTDSDSDD